MFCRKCGSEILEDSLFCPKCGCQVQNIAQDNLSSNDSPLIIEDQIPEKLKDEAEDAAIISESDNCNLSKEQVPTKMPLSKKIAIIIGALVVCLIGYSGYYQNAYNSAKNLYAQEKYYDAAKKLDGLINLTGDKEFETIKFAKEIGSDYSFYKTEMNYDEKYRNYSNAASNLFEGLKSCIDAEKKYTDTLKVSNIANFKEKYYSELSSQFDISQSEADRIASSNYEQIKSESDTIEIKKLAADRQQKDKRNRQT